MTDNDLNEICRPPHHGIFLAFHSRALSGLICRVSSLSHYPREVREVKCGGRDDGIYVTLELEVEHAHFS